jgi:hypothetical protein
MNARGSHRRFNIYNVWNNLSKVAMSLRHIVDSETQTFGRYDKTTALGGSAINSFDNVD